MIGNNMNICKFMKKLNIKFSKLIMLLLNKVYNIMIIEIK